MKTDEVACALVAKWLDDWATPVISYARDALEERIAKALNAERERCASICEKMVVGGRAWNDEQKIAADALLTAAERIRSTNPL